MERGGLRPVQVPEMPESDPQVSGHFSPHARAFKKLRARRASGVSKFLHSLLCKGGVHDDVHGHGDHGLMALCVWCWREREV